jgi:hypothetical protein
MPTSRVSIYPSDGIEVFERSSDGERILIKTESGKIDILDNQTGDQVLILFGDATYRTRVARSSTDGGRVACNFRDGRVYIYSARETDMYCSTF